MSRRKLEITGHMNERDFPHIVELELPPGGFRNQSFEFNAFHRDRGIPIRRGRSWHKEEQFYVRFGAGVHVEPHSHTNEQIVWMLKGKMEFRLGSEQRVCGQGDVVVIPGGAEHEASIREDTEAIDFFAPPRDDFLLGGKPAYMSEG
jgi:quercetin dioxygenase-like cupin family protein